MSEPVGEPAVASAVRRPLDIRLSPASLPYVVATACLAGVGFAAESPALILLAFALTLPSGLIALVGYYVLYGLLTLIPGAGASGSSSGSGSSTAAGRVEQTVSSGDPATWFTVVAPCLGVLLVAAAAFVNVVLWRAVVGTRRS